MSQMMVQHDIDCMYCIVYVLCAYIVHICFDVKHIESPLKWNTPHKGLLDFAVPLFTSQVFCLPFIHPSLIYTAALFLSKEWPHTAHSFTQWCFILHKNIFAVHYMLQDILKAESIYFYLFLFVVCGLSSSSLHINGSFGKTGASIYFSVI